MTGTASPPPTLLPPALLRCPVLHGPDARAAGWSAPPTGAGRWPAPSWTAHPAAPATPWPVRTPSATLAADQRAADLRPSAPVIGPLFRKQVLPVGRFVVDGHPLDLTPDLLHDAARAFAAGAVPVVPFWLAGFDNRHPADDLDPADVDDGAGAGRVVALVVDLAAEHPVTGRPAPGLYAVLRLSPAAAAIVDATARFGVSARLLRGYLDRAGRRWPVVVSHVLGTWDPALPGLAPWVDLAGRRDGRSSTGSAAPAAPVVLAPPAVPVDLSHPARLDPQEVPVSATTAVDDRVRRTRAASFATAAATGQLVALRLPDPAREIRLANEAEALHAELDDLRGGPGLSPAELREITGREEFYDADGNHGTRLAGAEGTADGSRYGRHSTDLGTLDLSHPLDDDPAPVTGSVDAYFAAEYEDDPDDAAQRADDAATCRAWARL